jgi:DNA (cytosine-5)-methyltransferase 1
MITQIWIDLFCGAGGTTTGLHQARFNGKPFAIVGACVNHDRLAIESHAANHKETLHFTEDIRFMNLEKLVIHINILRKKYPNAKVYLWASMECTNFSNAKGGQARDADSRSLADHMDRYVLALNPDYFYYENVTEFMSWGPLDINGKPLSRLHGQDFVRWTKSIQDLGYFYEDKTLNAADFGAYQSRERLFGIFAKPGLPISWPVATHVKTVKPIRLFDNLEKWKPVREVLDLQEHGESIFGRKKPLVENTLRRLYSGLKKFVAKGEGTFLVYNQHTYAQPETISKLYS